MTISDYEYPDAAGYPDGTGTLDEGTAARPVLPKASDSIEDEFADFLDE